MIVITGESGSGKTTIERKLVDRGYKRGISHTTRKPRNGEKEGVDYYYTSTEKIKKMNAEGKFAEYIPYLDNIYALSIDECKEDRVVVVSATGLKQLQEKEFLDLFVVYLYATEETRRERMLGRGDEPNKVEERLEYDRVEFNGISEKASIIIDTDNKPIEKVVDELIEKYTNI